MKKIKDDDIIEELQKMGHVSVDLPREESQKMFAVILNKATRVHKSRLWSTSIASVAGAAVVVSMLSLGMKDYFENKSATQTATHVNPEPRQTKVPSWIQQIDTQYKGMIAAHMPTGFGANQTLSFVSPKNATYYKGVVVVPQGSPSYHKVLNKDELTQFGKYTTLKVMSGISAANVPPSQSAHLQSKLPSVTSICMINQATGWATGNGTVWLTTNGGAQWKNVNINGLDTASNLQMKVFAVDGRNAWVAAWNSDALTNLLSLYHTSNGGQTWVKQSLHDTGEPMSLHFRDQTHGWMALLQGAAAGSEGETIYQTSDGGITWNKVSVTSNVNRGSLPFGGDKTGASFIDTQHGWATGFTPVNGHIYLYQTKDDGQTWNAQVLPVPSQLRDAQFMSYPPVFFDQQDGVLPVSFSSGLLVYRTTDGGQTWQPGTPITTIAQNQIVGAWSFPGMNSGFAASGSELFNTTDGGQTWKSLSPNVSLLQMTTLQFTSSTDGWALTNTGVLYHMINRGQVWTRIN